LSLRDYLDMTVEQVDAWTGYMQDYLKAQQHGP